MTTSILMLAGFAAALVAGVFLSFSDFVMRGLAQAPNTYGAAGMVELNRTVYRSVFMVMLLGLALSAIAIAILALWQLQDAARAMMLIGSATFLSGVMAVTALGNVPMNTRLDDISGQPLELAVYWPVYARRWTRLNHIRTVSAATTAVCWLAAVPLI